MPVVTPAWYEIVWSWPHRNSGSSWVRSHSAASALAEFRRRLGTTHTTPEDAVVDTVERISDHCPECHRTVAHTRSCPLDW